MPNRNHLWNTRRDFLGKALAVVAGGLGISPTVLGQASSLHVTHMFPTRPMANPGGAFSGAGGDDSPLGEKIGTEAEHIVHTLHNTHYQHDEQVDIATGTYDVDCSGFVSLVLKQAAPEHLQVIPKESGWAIPRAFKYEEFFHSLSSHPEKGWHAVQEISQVRRGDIMAWAIPQNLGKDEDTGHVFVVAAAPEKLEVGLFAVRVCDSSTVPHYDDSRVEAGGKFNTGVGTGTIHIKADNSGKPLSFQFGKGDQFHPVPIAMGRAV